MPEDTHALANVDDFAEYAGLGLEAIKSSDLVVPRVTILQAMSPAVTAEDSDVKAGVIYNLTTGESLGKSVEFVLLNYWLSRTKWEPDEDGKQVIGAPIECIAPDGENGSRYGACGKCQFANWDGKKPPLCTDFKNLIMLIKPNNGGWEDANWANFAAKRSALTPTNRLLTTVKTWIQSGVKMPIFAGIYEMSAGRREGQGGVFYVPDFKRIGIVPKTALAGVHARWSEFEEIRAEAIKVAAEQNAAEGDDESPAGATATSGAEMPY
jgi:hypothetical protein